ncbi:MAG: hypothetical protein R2727_07475 [Bacteroidales bacterium]
MVKGGKVRGVTTSGGETFSSDNVILATGHSARDIYQLLSSQQNPGGQDICNGGKG